MNRQDYINYRMTKEAFFNINGVMEGIGKGINMLGHGLWNGGKAAYNGIVNSGKAVGGAAKNMWNQGNAYADQKMQNREVNGVGSTLGAVGQHMTDHVTGMINNVASNTAGRLKQPGRYLAAYGRNLWNRQSFEDAHRNAAAYASAKYVPYNGREAALAEQQANYNPSLNKGLSGEMSEGGNTAWQNYNNNYLYPQQAAQLAAAGVDSKGLPVPKANQQQYAQR